MLRKYYDDKQEAGIYSVDEVSELLGIPRPTLYRYLREYSIPSSKRAGRISIPEDSLERIRRARDLHREGLGTGSVRLRLQGGAGRTAADSEELASRLDRLSQELEGLKGDSKSLDEASSPHALRTILARQSLLISAVFNLTEMVDDLLRSTGQVSRRPFDESGREAVREAELEGGAPETKLARSRSVGRSIRVSNLEPEPSGSPTKRVREFGSLAKRRKRGAVGVLAALLICALTVFLVSAVGLLSGEQQNVSSQNSQNASQQTGAPESVETPDLSGSSRDQAESRLENSGLSLGEVRGSEGGEGGEVVSQDPKAGAEVPEDETVDITLDSNEPPPDNGVADEASPAASQYSGNGGAFEYTEQRAGDS